MKHIFRNTSQSLEIQQFQAAQSGIFCPEQECLNLDNFFSAPQNTNANEPIEIQHQEAVNEEPSQQHEDSSSLVPEQGIRRKKAKPTITSDTRLSNYVFPNIVRETKQCLSNSFQAENKGLYRALLRFFKEQNMNFQIWAFDAILTSLIFLRDKTNLLSSKKYFAIIDLISSTLVRFLQKFIQKPYTQKQREYLRNQYNFCIQHLKVYDDQNQTFDSLSGENGKHLKSCFFSCLLQKRMIQLKRFDKYISNVERALNLDLLEIVASQKQIGINKMENNGNTV